MSDSPRPGLRSALSCVVALTIVLGAAPCRAQLSHVEVLTRTGDSGASGALQVDRGAVGAWQKLLRARTTASVLYTASHPDDEEPGVLTLLSRGMGVRTALLTLNRGEGGANAIGPELFDALGLIRTEELRLAGRYYGLDDQYFTTAVDYGYSKTLDEAMRSWDRERVLGDMVRIIRTNRPLVVISRWHGSERDGHGHHQAAGVLTPEAVEAAADPARFPEQISEEGLRPWRVRRAYRGRLQANEPHDVTLDPYRTSPWLGSSYQDFGSYGLSLQRSQTAGRRRSGSTTGPPARYQRVDEASDEASGSSDATATTLPAPTAHPLFAGLDVSISGIGRLTGEALPTLATSALTEADERIRRAIASFEMARPEVVVPDLLVALERVRAARSTLTSQLDADFLLGLEERRLVDAVTAAAGIEVSAHAVRRDDPPDSPMGPAVPGDSLDVHVRISPVAVPTTMTEARLRSRAGWTGGPTDRAGTPDGTGVVVRDDLADGAAHMLTLTVPADAQTTRPWFHRADIRMNHYEVLDSAKIGRGESAPDLEATVTLEFDVDDGDRRVVGSVELAVPVHTISADPPRGPLRRPFAVVSPVAVRIDPAVLIARPGATRFDVSVQLSSDAVDGAQASVALDLPPGWRADPEARPVAFTGAAQSEALDFVVVAPTGPAAAAAVEIRASARVGERTYRRGYRLIEHDDLFPQRLYEDARLTIEFVDVDLPAGLRVGYVMGVGDDVPGAIEQLGASVTLLDESDLVGADLGRWDAIVVGTRAYAVRPDLIAANDRLIDYARAGGNLVVLYQTPEYRPEQQAPFAASLPRNAEEVSEEDAPVRILAPEHPLLRSPNVIGPEDFEDWVEQRGSKFFATWSAEYTPLIETHDTGQAPQEGVWVTAPVGEGRFTYVALALHRQLPYGVHGAYRILANLLAGAR